MQMVFALVDCNNFYTIFEKLFRPDLKHMPVVVLLNNDGCIVARSKEVKALGVNTVSGTGRNKKARHCVVELCADMSNRVMAILEQEAPRLEVYSIDEAFMDLTGMDHVTDLLAFGKQVKAKVDQWTGITVGVGISPTKTLAKLANLRCGETTWGKTPLPYDQCVYSNQSLCSE